MKNRKNPRATWKISLTIMPEKTYDSEKPAAGYWNMMVLK